MLMLSCTPNLVYEAGNYELVSFGLDQRGHGGTGHRAEQFFVRTPPAGTNSGAFAFFFLRSTTGTVCSVLRPLVLVLRDSVLLAQRLLLNPWTCWVS